MFYKVYTSLMLKTLCKRKINVLNKRAIHILTTFKVSLFVVEIFHASLNIQVFLPQKNAKIKFTLILQVHFF